MPNNLALTSSNAALLTSGSLRGGLNSADTQGQLFLSGESNLRLATTVRVEMTAVDPASGAVTLALSYYDDDGNWQGASVPLPASGESNAVNGPGLGGLSLYRDGESFKLVSVMELQVGYYQGNQEDESSAAPPKGYKTLKKAMGRVYEEPFGKPRGI